MNTARWPSPKNQQKRLLYKKESLDDAKVSTRQAVSYCSKEIYSRSTIGLRYLKVNSKPWSYYR